MKIFLDMDEVLVDLLGGIARINGLTRTELEDRRRGRWEVAPALDQTPEACWGLIRSHGEAFWLGLQPLPWHRELIHLVETITDNWYIVSHPQPYAECYAGKLKWIQRYFGRDFERLLLVKDKHLLADSRSILIDDREENINRFVMAGGVGILFPSSGNRRYDLSGDPINHLKRHPLLVSKERSSCNSATAISTKPSAI